VEKITDIEYVLFVLELDVKDPDRLHYKVTFWLQERYRRLVHSCCAVLIPVQPMAD
jgi:hypothetical protein